jgi:peptide/nickel transport system ATP-binding protein
MARLMIDVEDLRVRFGATEVLKGISFAVDWGRSFGLVGESGSGKSTVLRVLSGLNREWSGAISIDGEPQAQRRSKTFFRRVQMVFQDPYGSLNPRQTIDEALSEPLIVHHIGDVDPRVRRAIAEVSLSPSVRFRYPHQLSGGQRQRVAIARALIAEPQILLLDEPTSALDFSVQAEVLNLLSDLQASRHLTYVLVSHNLAVIAHLCDTLGVMNGGEIVEILSSEVLRNGEAKHPYTRSLRALCADLMEAGEVSPGDFRTRANG